ncbi:MAG: BrnT family toxin [Burkholderiales bacterium]|nr:BrnT family toxin [Burkholderiales bacterium]
MQFEWDENKNQSNAVKHGVSFELAKYVFVDKDKIIKPNRMVQNEQRLQIIGEIDGVVVIMLVFTPRNQKIRIISARRANKKEKVAYYENKQKIK